MQNVTIVLNWASIFFKSVIEWLCKIKDWVFYTKISYPKNVEK